MTSAVDVVDISDVSDTEHSETRPEQLNGKRSPLIQRFVDRITATDPKCAMGDTTPALHTAQKLDHWVECRIRAKDAKVDLIKSIEVWQKKQTDPRIRAQPISDLHVTLIYGFGDSHRDMVKRVVPDEAVAGRLSVVRAGHKDPVGLLIIKSLDLTDIFWRIYRNVPGCPHYLVDGQFFDPHVTLVTWTRGADVSNDHAPVLVDVDAFDNIEVELYDFSMF